MRNFLRICILLLPVISKAQHFELGVNAGVMNYNGNLQSRNITLNQSHFTAGANITYQLSPSVGVQLGFLQGKVSAADAKNSNPKTVPRNLSFYSAITDVSLNLQYTFLANNDDIKIKPYVFAGLGVYHFNPYTYDTLGVKYFLKPLSTEGEGLPEYPNKKPYDLTQLNIPFGFGIKYILNDTWQIGIEFNYRKLFTSYLDDVGGTYPDSAILRKEKGPKAVELSFRGNELNPRLKFPNDKPRATSSSDDAFYSGVLRLIYVFPEKDYYHTRFRGVRCPGDVR
jgi:hypothetical protein